MKKLLIFYKIKYLKKNLYYRASWILKKNLLFIVDDINNK